MKKLSSLVSWVNLLKAKSQERLFLFRLFATILAIDFIAFLSLASVSPLKLLNPFAFLSSEEIDQRLTVSLYFPSAFANTTELTSLSLMEVKQKVYQKPIPQQEGRKEAILENARYIAAQLELGSDDLKARRIIKGKNTFKDFWLYKDILVVKINPSAWANIPSAEQSLAAESIKKSLAANLPIARVELDF